MGLLSKIFSGIKKIVKGVAKGIKKVVKGVAKVVKKVAKSKIFKAIMIAAAIYVTGGAAAGAFGASGTGFFGSWAASSAAITGGTSALGAFGKVLDTIVDSKLGKTTKIIAPFVPYVGAAWMTDVVLKSGKEAFEEEEDIVYEPVYPGALTRIKRDSETMPKAAIRFGSEALGRDPEADLQAARIAEEWVSPIPATAITMQGEEIIPYQNTVGEAISEQIRKLFPKDFNIGGIRGR